MLVCDKDGSEVLAGTFAHDEKGLGALCRRPAWRRSGAATMGRMSSRWTASSGWMSSTCCQRSAVSSTRRPSGSSVDPRTVIERLAHAVPSVPISMAIHGHRATPSRSHPTPPKAAQETGIHSTHTCAGVKSSQVVPAADLQIRAISRLQIRAGVLSPIRTGPRG
ncbi:MAG: hypothetical protein ACRDPM_02545 [Solirubrobacteraceae bacterium]